MKKIYEELSDQELIRRYLTLKEERACEILVRRYYDKMYKRIRKSINDDTEAHDLCQQLWIKVLRNIGNYQDEGKFINYLNLATTNLIKDYWRSSYNNPFDAIEEPNLESKQGLVEDDIDARAMMSVVVTELLPALAPKLRLPFLLKHESEYWEDKKRLMWHHLGEMNGMTASVASKVFTDARDKLLLNTHSAEALKSLSEDEKILFLVWTQAQRQDKNFKVTEDYLAKLMGISVSTFKTRYRTALKELREGIEKWR